ncbi:hypothetical protein [Butyrivibrio sp. VCB2001]|uniref:hypothetical protein n=1 Tax=Butyrivibrio sp. VCB2001 TaxID=1280667 RepID=UPI00041F529B|nr:hypothetical protein [Butyrivibrio sp. VCB2001]
MIREQLASISMNGRMAYGIMCVEQFLLSLYPDRDWTILSEQMWPVTNMFWDEWNERFMEIIPKYLFEFENYKEAEFEYLSENDYAEFVKLYSGISDGEKEDVSDPVNFLLLALYRIEEVYAYASIPGKGEECLDILDEMMSVLNDASVQLPDVNKVAFSSFDEKNGWGESFEGRDLSFVL